MTSVIRRQRHAKHYDLMMANLAYLVIFKPRREPVAQKQRSSSHSCPLDSRRMYIHKHGHKCAHIWTEMTQQLSALAPYVALAQD